MAAYYNEIDRYAAQWLRNLIDAGHIAAGVVDERSIEDVCPADLQGFTQCHFFAGIGVWSLALRRAGWPDDRPVWTGSCPCQPFSSAGKGAGFADERHLWPAWFHLISECRPPVIYGEQVANSDVGPWLDLVQADVEALDYPFGCVPFPSAGVGAPHIRDRCFWMADTNRSDPGQRGIARSAQGPRLQRRALANGCGISRWLGDSASLGQGGRPGLGAPGHGDAEQQPKNPSAHGGRPGPTNGLWRVADWLLCRDGRWRPVEPGSFPLAHGVANRVGRLRAYGNAINASAAEIFIRSTMT